MSLKKVHENQPNEFKFSEENLKKAEEILTKYPKKNRKSAVMPFLYLALSGKYIKLKIERINDLENSNFLPKGHCCVVSAFGAAGH